MSKVNNGIDARNLSLEQLEVLGSTRGKERDFKGIISYVFSGRDNQGVKKRFLDKKAPDRQKCRKHYAEYLDVMNEEKAAMDADIVKEAEHVESKEKEHQQKIKELVEAQKALERAATVLKNAKAFQEKMTADYQKLEKTIVETEKILKEMDKGVLIHTSAKLNQILDCKYGTFVVSDVDEPVLSKIGCVDEIFDTKGVSFISNLPHYLNSSYSEEEIASMISYANMVICYSLERENDFVLLYSCEAIADILRMNGFDM